MTAVPIAQVAEQARTRRSRRALTGPAAPVEPDPVVLARRSVAAAMEERARLAHVLHDDVLQSMVAARLALDLVGRTLRDSTVLEPVHAALDQAVADARLAMWELRPRVSAEGGLHAALTALAERRPEQVALVAEGDVAPGLLAEMAYRLVDECVREAPERVAVELARVPEGIVLTVRTVAPEAATRIVGWLRELGAVVTRGPERISVVLPLFPEVA